MVKKQSKIKHATRQWTKDVIYDDDVVVYFSQFGDNSINAELSTGDGSKRVRLSLTEKEKVLLALEAKRKDLRIRERSRIEVYSPEKKPKGWENVVKVFQPILDELGLEKWELEHRLMVLPHG